VLVSGLLSGIRVAYMSALHARLNNQVFHGIDAAAWIYTIVKI